MIVLKVITAYIAIGIAPVFLFALYRTKSAEYALSWAMAASGLPFIIIQVIAALTGADFGIAWILPFLLISISFLLLIIKHGILHQQDWSDFTGRIAAGTTVGILWWISGFLPNAYRMRVYPDVLWNIGNASQFMHSLHIQDPHWFQETCMSYHFYSHRVIAGIGLFTGTDLIQIVIIPLTLITTISIATLATAKELRKSICYGIIAVVLVFLLRPTERWGANRSFMMHMTGYAASTYFWSLPLTIGGILWWFRWDSIRYEFIFSGNSGLKKILSPSIITLFIVIAMTYSKASGALVFISVEFISFINVSVLLFRQRLFFKRFMALPWYGISLAAFLLADLLFFRAIGYNTGGNYGLLSFGFESRDFTNLKGGILTAFFAVSGLPVIFFLLKKRPARKQIALLAASFLNFLIFLCLKHPGYADFFFIFNSIILGIFSVSTGLDRKTVARFGLSVIILSASCIIFSWAGLGIKGFYSFFKFGFRPASVEIMSHETFDLFTLKRYIRTNELVVYPYATDETFRLSSITQARFWNESAVFTMYTYKEPGTQINFNGIPETIEDRTLFTTNWVFNSQYAVPEQYKNIVSEFGYVIILSSDTHRLASRFKNSEIKTSGKWSLVILD